MLFIILFFISDLFFYLFLPSKPRLCCFVPMLLTAFLSPSCAIDFFLKKKYRLFLLLIFLTPLIFMLIIYVRIFFAIKKNDYQRQKLCASQRTTTTNREKNLQASLIRKRWYKKVARLSLETTSIATEITNESLTIRGHEVEYAESTDGSFNVSTRGSPECMNRRKRLHTHSKALCTTLLILGTYLFCWMPAVVFLALTCDDDCPFPLKSIPTLTIVLISVLCNSLVVLKAIVDPFIYTLRMKEVKDAIKRARGN